MTIGRLRAVLAAVSTEHKIGMLVVAGIFIVFALAASFLFPRYWPQFPGRNGLGAFVVASIVLFVAMMLAVEFFAVEEEEPHVGDAEPAAAEQETGPAETAPAESAPAETTPPPGGAPAQTVNVAGTEFAFALTPGDVHPGVVIFRLENEGQLGHDLVVEGPGLDDAKTPVIEPGQMADMEVKLQEGDYELYCSVPGHRDAGMEVDLEVS